MDSSKTPLLLLYSGVPTLYSCQENDQTGQSDPDDRGRVLRMTRHLNLRTGAHFFPVTPSLPHVQKEDRKKASELSRYFYRSAFRAHTAPNTWLWDRSQTLPVLREKYSAKADPVI